MRPRCSDSISGRNGPGANFPYAPQKSLPSPISLACATGAGPVLDFPPFNGHKTTPGWASCDAQPGYELSLDQPVRSGSQSNGLAATATPLLDHRDRTADEREGAATRGWVDLGDT